MQGSTVRAGSPRTAASVTSSERWGSMGPAWPSAHATSSASIIAARHDPSRALIIAPPGTLLGRPHPQRAVARGRETESGLEHPREVRLIGEAGVAGHVDQTARPANPLAGEVEAAHEQIAMRARAERDPELAGQIVAAETGDRL